MDSRQFDRLTQHLAATLSRRRFGVGLAVLGAASGMGSADAQAAKKKKKKKKKKKRAPGGTEPTGPTCNNDGVRNEGETDVDCGGPDCPACENGQGCANRLDCRSGRCSDRICRICTEDRDCGSDINDDCFCNEITGTCLSTRQSNEVADCNACPDDWQCFESFDGKFCYPVCGSSDSCGTFDYCKAEYDECGRGGRCFQPTGNRPTRCGTSIFNSCGCVNDQHCIDQFGAGTFCTLTGTVCTCGDAITFCTRAI